MIFKGSEPGAVTIIQRFGGSLNVNPHFHKLVLEGGYYNTQHGPRFWWVDPPTDEEIKVMVNTFEVNIDTMVFRLYRLGDGSAGFIGHSPFTQNVEATRRHSEEFL